MKKKNYFVLEIGKIIVDIVDDVYKFRKEIDGNFFELTDIEKEIVDKLFVDENPEIYKSELTNCLVLNNSFIEKKNHVMPFIDSIESIIPDKYRSSLYNNLSKLKATLNYDINYDEYEKGENDSNFSYYHIKKTELVISPVQIKLILDETPDIPNRDQVTAAEVDKILVHELLHMASTSYDKNENAFFTGFDKLTGEKNIVSNRGLNEGFTDVLANYVMSYIPTYFLSYEMEICFVNQLIQIIGKDVFIKSYFGNLGVTKLVEELTKIIPDEEMALELFRKIEINFRIGKEDIKQDVLGDVQSTLITYYKEKIKNDVSNWKITLEDTEKHFTFYETLLVTPQRVFSMNKNPDNCIGLSESVDKFIKYKDIWTWARNSNIFNKNKNSEKAI